MMNGDPSFRLSFLAAFIAGAVFQFVLVVFLHVNKTSFFGLSMVFTFTGLFIYWYIDSKRNF